MRPEVISEAIKNISEEYKLEALELHDQAVVSEITNMKSHGISKKVVVVGLAASLTLALGVTAYATDFFGIKQRDAAPGESLTIDYNIDDGEGGTFPQAVTYDKVSKYLSFDGPTSCNKVEFKVNYLPAGYIDDGIFGDPTDWNDNIVQVLDPNYRVYNIQLYYTAQFGPDGFMFFEDDFKSVEETKIGEFDALKMTGNLEGDYEAEEGVTEHYSYDTSYIILQHPDGYIFFIGGADMGELENIANGIEIRPADGVINYDANDGHSFYMVNGVG